MRWKVHAIPRVWWETAGTFDGISTYKLDNQGMIYEHKVDNVQLRDPPITNPILYGLNFLMSPRLQPQQQIPCPGSWFQDGDSIDDMENPTPAAGWWVFFFHCVTICCETYFFFLVYNLVYNRKSLLVQISVILWTSSPKLNFKSKYLGDKNTRTTINLHQK